MGLLSWRRSARGPDRAPTTAAATAAEPEPVSGSNDHEVIRAATLADAPDWAKLPPLEPLLPEMPWVVSQHFDESLVSWRAPERFLAPLGHSVSPAAPSGVIDGLAILSPAPAPEPVAAPIPFPPDVPAAHDQPLTLAVPPAASTEQEGRRRRGSSRTLPLPSDQPTFFRPDSGGSRSGAADPTSPPPPGPPGAGAPALSELAGSMTMPDPAAAAVGSDEPPPRAWMATESGPVEPLDSSSGPVGNAISTAGPAGSAGLAGSAPLRPTVSPLLVPPQADEAPHRLVQAPTPPDMPLARLPSALLPEILPDESGVAAGVRTTPPGLGAPVDEPAASTLEAHPPPAAPAPTAGLVGERAVVDESGPSAPPAMVPPPSPAPFGAAGAELPLALSTPRASAGEAPPVAPLVGAGPPDGTDEPAGAPTPRALEAHASPRDTPVRPCHWGRPPRLVDLPRHPGRPAPRRRLRRRPTWGWLRRARGRRSGPSHPKRSPIPSPRSWVTDRPWASRFPSRLAPPAPTPGPRRCPPTSRWSGPARRACPGPDWANRCGTSRPARPPGTSPP